jgi:hypothetical protein
MLRRLMCFSLAMVVVLAGVVSMASAAQNVANTTQKGSLLIWPKIMVEPDAAVDTIIYLGNDYYQDVWVKCYWVDQFQNIQDFQFRLTPNQPVMFSAFYGDDFGTLGGSVTVPPFGDELGELKCWAVNAAGDSQIAFNHLYGNALIKVNDPTTAGGTVVYNAWSFTARGVALGDSVGTAGNLQLTGLTNGYDACPQSIIANFSPFGTSVTDGTFPDLTLVPCKQDLRQDRTPTCTKAKFDIWNANETKFTGAYQCTKCWFEGILENIGTDGSWYNYYYGTNTGYGGDKFSLFTLKTWADRFRVTGVASPVCNNKFVSPGNTDLNIPPQDLCTGGQVASPFLALMIYGPLSGTDLVSPFAGFTPHGAGADGSGFILWDPAGDTPTASPR